MNLKTELKSNNLILVRKVGSLFFSKGEGVKRRLNETNDGLISDSQKHLSNFAGKKHNQEKLLILTQSKSRTDFFVETENNF